jgi:hypothetical protein
VSTQYTRNAGLPYPQLDDTAWHVPLQNAILGLDACAAIGPFAVHPSAPGSSAALPSLSLQVDVGGGSFLNGSGLPVAFPGASGIALPPNTKTRIWLDDTATLNTGAVYPPATQIVPLATATTTASSVTAIGDDRIVWRSFGGPASGYLLKAGDSLGDGSSFALGTASGTRFGTAATQKLGFLGATPIAQEPASADLRQVLIDFGLLAPGGSSPLNLNGGILTGALRLPVTTVSSSVALSTLGLVLVSAAGNLTLALPDASSNIGGILILKRTDATANPVTITRAGTDLIDGSATNTALSVQWAVLRLVAGAGGWYSV